MIHMKQKKQKTSLWKYLSSLLILGGCLYLLLTGTKDIAAQTDTEQLKILTQAIQRASIQCYAIEGQYPPSVEYLEEHYGIQVDEARYTVAYDVFASNMMPDITVLEN